MFFNALKVTYTLFVDTEKSSSSPVVLFDENNVLRRRRNKKSEVIGFFNHLKRFLSVAFSL